jgi:hypothetical protein
VCRRVGKCYWNTRRLVSSNLKFEHAFVSETMWYALMATARESLRWALQQKDWNRVQVSGSMAEGAIVHLPQVYYRGTRKASPEFSSWAREGMAQLEMRGQMKRRLDPPVASRKFPLQMVSLTLAKGKSTFPPNTNAGCDSKREPVRRRV